MTRDEIFQGVLNTLQSIAPEVDGSGLKADTLLRDQVDLDSMDWLHVIVGFQERFGVAIPEADSITAAAAHNESFVIVSPHW